MPGFKSVNEGAARSLTVSVQTTRSWVTLKQNRRKKKKGREGERRVNVVCHIKCEFEYSSQEWLRKESDWERSRWIQVAKKYRWQKITR